MKPVSTGVPVSGPSIDHDRVGVAADIVVLFEEGNLVTALQQMGRRNPGNPTADHGDPQTDIVQHGLPPEAYKPYRQTISIG